MHNRSKTGLAVGGRLVAGDLAPGAGDAEVLAAVVAHYCTALADDDQARKVLVALGVDEETARALRVGYSDRSLGPALRPQAVQTRRFAASSAHPPGRLPLQRP